MAISPPLHHPLPASEGLKIAAGAVVFIRRGFPDRMGMAYF